jgi:dimeric dUTPase (all-alpha-NTP-PPase superfamily)
MNLVKLFEMQKVLRDRIAYNEPDRFNKLVLALLVELGECANEWRGFKFWSKNQEPRTKKFDEDYDLIHMESCGLEQSNPLLEEYVDGLHFVLELGIECNISPMIITAPVEFDNNTEAFITVFNYVTTYQYDQSFYIDMLDHYLGLGKSLGFTWEQIEQAYLAKNTINHQRQEENY